MINPANIDLAKNAFPLTMYPLELLFHRGRIHIAGATKEIQCLIFAVDKAFEFSLTNETFSRKKYIAAYKEKLGSLYGIAEPINNKVYNIKLEFTESYAESMKNFHWHPTEKWEQLKSGNYVLHLHCSIGRDLVGFVAIGLDKVKVHQPKVLKDLMIKKFKLSALVNEKNLMISEEVANEDY